MDFNRASNFLAKRNGTLCNRDREAVAIPMQCAWPNLKSMLIAVNPFTTALGHSPALIAGAVNCHIERAIVIGIGWLRSIGPGIVGREHTADKGNDGDPVLTIVTQCINIPPEVITRIYRLVELRRAISAATA